MKRRRSLKTFAMWIGVVAVLYLVMTMGYSVDELQHLEQFQSVDGLFRTVYNNLSWIWN